MSTRAPWMSLAASSPQIPLDSSRLNQLESKSKQFSSCKVIGALHESSDGRKPTHEKDKVVLLVMQCTEPVLKNDIRKIFAVNLVCYKLIIL